MDYREKTIHGDRNLPVHIVRLHPEHIRYRMNLHWHPEHEILYVQSGALTIKLNETVYELRTGDVLFIQGGTLHSAKPEDCRYDCILVELPHLVSANDGCMRFADRLREEEIRVDEYLGNAKSPYAALCRNLLTLDDKDPDSYSFLIRGILYEFFGRILKEKRYQQSVAGQKNFRNLSGKMKAAITFIEKNYSSSIHLSDIAAEAEMSDGHFTRSFRAVTGVTPFDYLTHYRLSKAQYALTSTDMSVTEIALECGFNSTSYFISCFRNAYGISPGQYRRNAS